MTTPNSILDFLKREGGAIAVEFIIVLPMILAALYFVYELGRVLWAYEVVSQDVRTAIRYLARSDSATYDCSAATPTYPTPQASAITAAQNLAETGQAASGGTMHYPWTSAATFAVTTTNFSNAQFNECGTVVKMAAGVPMTLSFLAYVGAGTAYTISVTDTEQFIGD